MTAAAAGLARLNAMSATEAERELLKCCGSGRWVREVAAGRPFATLDQLMAAAEGAFERLAPDDWLEAFSHHPRIGERRLDAPRVAAMAGAREWSGKEQAGMAGASDQVRQQFVAGNEAYERAFGHVFLICATGRSGEEMLRELQRRMGNDPERELMEAAAEQRKITRLRIAKMLEELSA